MDDVPSMYSTYSALIGFLLFSPFCPPGDSRLPPLWVSSNILRLGTPQVLYTAPCLGIYHTHTTQLCILASSQGLHIFCICTMIDHIMLLAPPCLSSDCWAATLSNNRPCTLPIVFDTSLFSRPNYGIFHCVFTFR